MGMTTTVLDQKSEGILGRVPYGSMTVESRDGVAAASLCFRRLLRLPRLCLCSFLLPSLLILPLVPSHTLTCLRSQASVATFVPFPGNFALNSTYGWILLSLPGYVC